MDEKDLNELRELVEFLKENGIAQFEMERADLKVKLKFAGAATETGSPVGTVDLGQLAQMLGSGAPAGTGGSFASVPETSPSVASMTATAPDSVPAEVPAHLVKSPLVGTFYAASSPAAEPFVKVGDRVSTGQVLCIVEAMKLMNEVEADASGEITKVFAESGQPVEYGQPLFAIRS